MGNRRHFDYRVAMVESAAVAPKNEQSQPSQRKIDAAVPLSFVGASIGRRVTVTMQADRQIEAKLEGFDSHLNLLLSDAEETTVEQIFDQETGEKAFKKVKRKIPCIFVRGDKVISLGCE